MLDKVREMSKKLLFKILDITGLLVGLGAIAIALLDSLQVLNLVPDTWYPTLTVIALSGLIIYVVLERKLLLETLDTKIDLLVQGSQVEIADGRNELYKHMTEPMLDSSVKNPVRYLKIYAPLGFGYVDEHKQKWLESIRKLVIERRITDVEAIYGLPEDKIGLAKAANFLNHFFYEANDNTTREAEILRSHISVRGIMLAGAGKGIPRGFGMLTIEDKILVIAFAQSRGDKIVQGAISIRDKNAIKNMSEWYSSHAYGGDDLQILQEPTCVDDNKDCLKNRLVEILEKNGISKATIESLLGKKLLEYDEISELFANSESNGTLSEDVLASNVPPNNPLAHELESSAVIEGSKPDK